MQHKIQTPVKKGLQLDIIAQAASLFTAGPYYYYIINFETMQMEYVDKRAYDVLGINPKELTFDSILTRIHPDDFKCVYEKESIAAKFLFTKIPPADIPLYKIAYLIRLLHANGSYRTILYQSKALTISSEGKIQQVICIHTDVSYLHIPIDHKISFISSERPSYFSLTPHTSFQLEENNSKELFSKREKEIISLLAAGKNFKDIATALHLSPHTINTHKKNMLKKSYCNNTTQLVARCIREGLI